jgi:hypothetical protein
LQDAQNGIIIKTASLHEQAEPNSSRGEEKK